MIIDDDGEEEEEEEEKVTTATMTYIKSRAYLWMKVISQACSIKTNDER